MEIFFEDCSNRLPSKAGYHGKKEKIMTSVFGFLVVIIIVSIIVIIVDGASRVLPKNSL